MTLLLILVAAVFGWWAWERTRRRTHPAPEGHQPDIDIPYEQEFELYHNALSLCSMKSRVCMAELGIPYRSHHVDLIEHDPLRHGDESAGNAIPGLTIPLFAAMIERIPYWKILEGALFHFDRLRPFLFLTLKLRGLSRLGRITPVMKVLARSRAQMGVHLDALQRRPAYREAILAHGHATIEYGTRRLREAKASDPPLREALDGA